MLSAIIQFILSTFSEVHLAAEKAGYAFPLFRNEVPEARARFLNQIADNIMELGDTLLATCTEETALPLPRLSGERGRTCNQLRMFADVIKEGLYLNAIIDTPDPERSPVIHLAKLL